MAALAHIAVGLAASRAVPKPPSMSQFKHMVVFVLLADALDLIWRVLCLAGIEHDPSPGPWSHGLFMSVVWSAIAVLVAWRVSDSVRTGVLVGLVVYSRWVLDYITHPMTALIPSDPVLLLLFDGSPEVGLGLYRTRLGVYLCESGSF